MSNTTLTTQSLENIRQRLLDLSKRNQLLSYKEKVRTVHIVDTPLDKVFNQLVRAGKSMTFAPLPIDMPKELTMTHVNPQVLSPPLSIPSKSKQENLLQTAHQDEVYAY